MNPTTLEAVVDLQVSPCTDAQPGTECRVALLCLQVLIDMNEVASGSLYEDWDMLPPKKIKVWQQHSVMYWTGLDWHHLGFEDPNQ